MNLRVLRFRKTLLFLIAAGLAITAYLWIKPLEREWAPKLAPGKVEPCFAGKLLLAPNGTVWLGNYQDKGGKTEGSFTRFLPGDDWAVLTGSESQGVAIKQDGSLWWWFSTFTGNSAPPVFNPPTQLGSDRDWANAGFGWNSALLLKRDGSLWFLGGRFRDSTWGFVPLAPDVKPVQIGSDCDWRAIATSGFAHYALKQDGTLWHWGNLVYRGPYIETPALLSGDRDWRRIAANFSTLALLKNDGSLWFGGVNANAVAGELVVRGQKAPFSAGTDSDWVNIVVGDNSLAAQKANGSWWASGENHYAHLGLPHWFGHSRHLGRPKRLPIELDVWAWDIGANTTKILTTRGNIYYIGKRPASTSSPSQFKQVINKAARWIPGAPPLFARPGEDWSEKPVKIGELPPEVMSALKGNQ